jgi:hypothetical protein
MRPAVYLAGHLTRACKHARIGTEGANTEHMLPRPSEPLANYVKGPASRARLQFPLIRGMHNLFAYAGRAIRTLPYGVGSAETLGSPPVNEGASYSAPVSNQVS